MGRGLASLIQLLFWIGSLPVFAGEVRHIVFDLDQTVVSKPGNLATANSGNWRWVQVQGKWYRVSDGA